MAEGRAFIERGCAGVDLVGIVIWVVLILLGILIWIEWWKQRNP